MPRSKPAANSSAGGAGAARGERQQDRVFAWASVAVLAERPLDGLGLAGVAVSVGAQTGLAVDDVGVFTDSGNFAVIQSKAGLKLATKTASDFAQAVGQTVRQYLDPDALVPAGGGSPRRFDPTRDVLVIATDGAASKPVRVSLANAVARVGSEPPGTPLVANLNADEVRALTVLLTHVRRVWVTHASAPTDEEVRTYLRALRVLTVAALPGEPQHAAAIATLRALVPPGSEGQAWRVLVDEGGACAEGRQWRNRARLATELVNGGVDLRPGRQMQEDIDRLIAFSSGNRERMASAMVLPEVALHLPRHVSTELHRALAEGGSLLVVGDAGEGKTGVAVGVVGDLAASGGDVLLLRATDVVGPGLGLSRPLHHVLANWVGTASATLVLDGLDAARGSDARADLADLVAALDGTRWRVVATIRTFDVLNSVTIREAFVGTPVSSGSAADARLPDVRHVRVGPLTDHEMQPVHDAGGTLAAVLKNANPDLARLLRNPFNLRLAATLTSGRGSAAVTPSRDLSNVHTRLELLDRYWQHRVEDANRVARDDVLRRLCAEMLDRHELRALQRPPVVLATDDGALTELLSASVLVHDEVISGGDHVLAFAHNILFDYAVTRYVLLDPLDTAGGLVRVLDADPSLPLIARPSLDLLTERLWYSDRGRFWMVAFAIAATEHLLASLAFTAWLVTADASAADVEPLIEALHEEPRRVAARKLVAQARAAMLMMDAAGSARAVEGVAHIAGALADDAAASPGWDDAALASDLINALDIRTPLSRDAPAASERARTVRILLDACRADVRGLEQIAGTVARHLRAAVEADGATAEAIQNLLDDSPALAQWGGTVLSHLAEAVPALLGVDPTLAQRVAVVIWTFDEQREEQVRFAGGALMPLVESRRQQAQHAQWVFAESFADACEMDLATCSAIFAEIANRGLYPSSKVEEQRQDWPLGVGDETAGWVQYGSPLEMLGTSDSAVTLGRVLRDALASAGESGTEPGDAVAVLVGSLRLASGWAGLLAPGNDPVGLARALGPALASGTLLVHPETHEEAAMLLTAASASVPDLPFIDVAVAAAAERARANDVDQHVVDELLGCVNPSRITVPELAKRLQVLADTGGPPPITRRPRDGIADIGVWSLVDRVEESGLPVPQDLAEAIRAIEAELTELQSGRRDERPASERRLPELFAALDTAARNADVQHDAIDALWTRAAGRLAADERVLAGTPTGELMIARLLTAAARGNAGRFLDSGDAWSPGGRDDAIHGLVVLLHRAAWRESPHFGIVADVVRSALDDPAPVVRYQAAQAIGAIHHQDSAEQVVSALRKRLLIEPDPHVFGMLLQQLALTAGRDPHGVDAALAEIASLPAGKLLAAPPESEAWLKHDLTTETAADVIAYLACVHRTPYCYGQVASWFTEPVRFANHVHGLLHNVRHYLNRVDGSGSNEARRLFAVASASIADAWRVVLPEMSVPDPPAAKSDHARVIAKLAHDIAEQVYFSTGAVEARRHGKDKAQPDPAFVAEALPILSYCAQVEIAPVVAKVVNALIELGPAMEREVLLAIATAVPAAGAYVSDPLASHTVMPYLRRLLADHRALVLGDPEGTNAFRHLLQSFAGAGDRDALTLAYMFSDIFR